MQSMRCLERMSSMKNLRRKAGKARVLAAWLAAVAMAWWAATALGSAAAEDPLMRRLPVAEAVPSTPTQSPESAWPSRDHGVFRTPGLGDVVPAVAGGPGMEEIPQGPMIGQSEPGSAIPPGQGTILLDPALVPYMEPWRFQVLPDGLIYRSYLAGVKEPRMASVWSHERSRGWLWDITLGGRAALLRYGTDDPLRPEGWEFGIEGAAMLRLLPEEDRDLGSCDYRFGIPLTFGRGPLQTKMAYYHLSSHLGDEFLLRHPGTLRDNYVRDSLVLGESFYLTDALRFYGEAAWAFYTDGRARPWEFQFGMEFSPAAPVGIRGAPFFAINAHLRQELDYRGNLVVQTGWQWRGTSGQLARLGMQYYVGKSDQWEFANQYEEKIGLGLWYDF
jgi:hypothetical protein